MTPWMRTALSCWNFFSSRGCVVVSSDAKVDNGTSSIARSGHVDLLELIRGKPLCPLDLRDHLVAAALDAETVHVVAAQHRREILAGLTQFDALRAQLVAIEDHFCLRLIELQVGVGEDEQPAGERLLHEPVGDLAELLRFSRPTR